MLEFYDQLMVVQPSPVVNRAVALARVEGAHAALDSLETVSEDPARRRSHVWHAVGGALAAQLGETREAAEYRAALQCQGTEPARRFLACGGRKWNRVPFPRISEPCQISR